MIAIFPLGDSHSWPSTVNQAHQMILEILFMSREITWIILWKEVSPSLTELTQTCYWFSELSLWTGLFKWARISLVVFLGEEVLKNWSRTNTVTSLGMEVIAEGLPLVCYIFSEPKGCFGFSFQSKKAAVFTQKLSSNPQGWKMKPTEKTAVPQMATWGSL